MVSKMPSFYTYFWHAKGIFWQGLTYKGHYLTGFNRVEDATPLIIEMGWFRGSWFRAQLISWELILWSWFGGSWPHESWSQGRTHENMPCSTLQWTTEKQKEEKEAQKGEAYKASLVLDLQEVRRLEDTWCFNENMTRKVKITRRSHTRWQFLLPVATYSWKMNFYPLWRLLVHPHTRSSKNL